MMRPIVAQRYKRIVLGSAVVSLFVIGMYGAGWWLLRADSWLREDQPPRSLDPDEQFRELLVDCLRGHSRSCDEVTQNRVCRPMTNSRGERSRREIVRELKQAAADGTLAPRTALRELCTCGWYEACADSNDEDRRIAPGDSPIRDSPVSEPTHPRDREQQRLDRIADRLEEDLARRFHGIDFRRHPRLVSTGASRILHQWEEMLRANGRSLPDSIDVLPEDRFFNEEVNRIGVELGNE